MLLLILFLVKTTVGDWYKYYLLGIVGKNSLLTILVYSMAYILLILFIWVFLDIYDEIVKKQKWFYCALFIGFGVIIIGTVAIFEIVGVPHLDSVLRDLNKEGNNVVGSVECSGDSRYYLINTTVQCKIKEPKLISFNSTVTVFLSNGTNKLFYSINDIEFKGTESTYYLFFLIEGYNEKGEFQKLGVGRAFSFMTQEQIIMAQERVLKYLLGLLGVALISVPLSMRNLKELYDEKRD